MRYSRDWTEARRDGRLIPPGWEDYIQRGRARGRRNRRRRGRLALAHRDSAGLEQVMGQLDPFVAASGGEVVR